MTEGESNLKTYLTQAGFDNAEDIVSVIKTIPGEMFVTRGSILDVPESNWVDSNDEGSEFTVYAEPWTP